MERLLSGRQLVDRKFPFTQISLPGKLERARQSLEANGFELLESYYDSQAFGNKFVELTKDRLSVQLILDRGEWSVQIELISGVEIPSDVQIVKDIFRELGVELFRREDVADRLRLRREVRDVLPGEFVGGETGL